MKIYFDGTEVSADYIASLTKSGKVYDEYFKVGSTICESYTLKVNKNAITTMPSIVTIYSSSILKKTLYVSDYNDDDNVFTTLNLEDGMTKLNFRYDASPIMVHTKTVGTETINYAYLSEIFADIISQAGLTTDISSFYGDDKEISWYNNTYMARDYLGYIAELNGVNVRMTANNKVEFIPINTTATDTITFDNIDSYRIGIQHIITRVVFDNGVNPSPWIYGNTNGETYYVNTNNVYINEAEDVENIYNEINGFTYYNFKTNNCPLNNINTGDIVAFTDGTNTYNTFTQFSNVKLSGSTWCGGIKVDLDGEVKQETKIVGDEDRYKMIQQTVDRMNNTVTTLVATTENLVETVQTDMYTKTEIQRIVDGTGVDGVKVTKTETMNGTFDIDGMHYEKNGAYTKSTINEAGVLVEKTANNEELLFAGYDNSLGKTVVRSENLWTKRYLVIGENSRIEDFDTGGGVFLL